MRAMPWLRDVSIVALPVTGGRFRLPYKGFAALRAAVAQADVVLLTNHWTAINLLACRHARAAEIPYVVCPAGALPVQGGRSPLLKRAYNALAGRTLIAEAAGHIAVTADETAQFAAYGIDPARVTVIPNAMPTASPGDGSAFRARYQLGEAPLLLYLGRLAPIKGPDLLIEAFARIADQRPAWQLVVAGPDDGMAGELKRRTQALGLADRVLFIGFVDAAAKAQALAAADLLVVPSRREAMSIVVLEAAAAGLAVLVTDQCGIPEAASHGGWVVLPTVDGLTQGLLDATSDRRALAAAGKLWRETATAAYSPARVARGYLDLLSSVVGGARR
jgi:glycosyltransferase involved in cell wall biosynthesis